MTIDMSSDLTVPSPIHRLPVPLFEKRGLELWVKREDLIHPEVSGNKWRKLKYNLLEAQKLGYRRLLTFGGAFSNHIYATAAAGKLLGFSTLGLIRGEKTEPLNPTLEFALACGMELIYLSRTAYRNKPQALEALDLDAADYYLLPEGGTNRLALPGCTETGTEILAQFAEPPDYVCLCCGTGGTMAGLLVGLEGKSKVLGFPVLKGDFFEKLIQDLLPPSKQIKAEHWSLISDYHFGGYARFTPPLIDLINHYQQEYQLPLDPIYTGKLFYGLEDLARKDFFPPGSKILAIHTGGLQGIAGFNQRFGPLIHH